MSMCVCKRCAAYVDSDDDPECFVEVGNMRRMNWTVIYCEKCREEIQEEQDALDEAADYFASIDERTEIGMNHAG